MNVGPEGWRCCDAAHAYNPRSMAKRKRPQPTDDPAGWYRDPILWAITALAALLLLVNLGGRCLWEDEAETALLGRSIIHHGVPVAVDGGVVISQEAGKEIGPDGVWRWSPWLQFYVAAAGLRFVGDSAFG